MKWIHDLDGPRDWVPVCGTLLTALPYAHPGAWVFEWPVPEHWLTWWWCSAAICTAALAADTWSILRTGGLLRVLMALFLLLAMVSARGLGSAMISYLGHGGIFL